MYRIQMLSMLGSVLVATLVGSTAWSYQDVLDDGEVMERGHFKATGSIQALTETGDANVTGIIDTGLQPDFAVRGLLGFGKTDYYFGGLLKWMPIPDADGQPAVGLNAGVTYAKWMSDVNDVTFRFEPLVSKHFKIDEAVATPYASLPIGLRMRSSNIHEDETRLVSQVVAGTQLQVGLWKNLQFIAEIGFDIDGTFNHLSTGAIMYFDTENPYSIE